jgi:hypothetical protein
MIIPLVADKQTIARKWELHINEIYGVQIGKDGNFIRPQGNSSSEEAHNPILLGVRTDETLYHLSIYMSMVLKCTIMSRCFRTY